MLSSKFLTLSLLYIFCATGLVAADPHWQPFGGNQFCESVRTVTITKTVAPGQSQPSSRPANSPSPSPPLITTRPGNVNLGNGSSSTSNIKSTKTPGVKGDPRTSTNNVNTKNNGVNTKTNGINTKPNGVNTKTNGVNTKTNGVNTKTNSVNTKTNGVNTKTNGVNTKTNGVNTKTSSVNTKTGGVNTKTSLSNPGPTNTKTSTALPPANTGAGDPSTSLTLDPSVIQQINGKGQAAGEKDSLVSPNDFIGFCVGKTITNGKQVQAGSCNPVPMGDIPSVDNMPSAKFTFPKNFGTLAANTPFTISLKVRNLGTGTFTNAANTYYAAPQQLVNGVIKGHSHVTVQKMQSLDSPEPLNPKVFDFFKGLNGVAQNGILTADVTKGLPSGVYRIFSINSAGNHQEALGPVAQRGGFNDAVYITVTDDGKSNNALSSSVAGPASSPTSSSVLNSTSTVLPTSTGKGGKDSKTSSIASLPISTGKGGKGGKDLKTSSTASLPVSTGLGGKGGKDSKTSSTVPLPVSTGSGGKKGNKGGDVTSTSAALPTDTPAAGNKPGTKNPIVSSSPAPPDSTPTQGGTGRGGSRQNRMHKRSRHI